MRPGLQELFTPARCASMGIAGFNSCKECIQWMISPIHHQLKYPGLIRTPATGTWTAFVDWLL